MKASFRKSLLAVALVAACAQGTAQVPAPPRQDPPSGARAEAPPSPAPTPPSSTRTPARRISSGAILPGERIVAYYGNPRSPLMGILGELPPDQMLARLDREVDAWQQADPATPVRPALHMIAVMATSAAGADGKHRLRLPRQAIEDVIEWAARRDAIVFLDVQPGLSTVAEELRHLLPYLERPNVHLALDPEWRMSGGGVPGERIGSMRADEVNHAIDALARLVAEKGLPPKVLVVHRFTSAMLPDTERIKNDPNVQVVLNMDGWGPPSGKIDSYRAWVAPSSIPYKGFKLFYKNDRRNGSRMMTPAEVLGLSPVPMYIQYQ